MKRCCTGQIRDFHEVDFDLLSSIDASISSSATSVSNLKQNEACYGTSFVRSLQHTQWLLLRIRAVNVNGRV